MGADEATSRAIFETYRGAGGHWRSGPRELALPPPEWAERLYDVRRYTVMLRGGHLPACEAPELYADDLCRHAVASLA